MALIPISSANFGGLVKGWKKAASGKQSWKVKEVREKSFDDEIGTIKYTLVPSTTYLSHSLMEITELRMQLQPRQSISNVCDAQET